MPRRASPSTGSDKQEKAAVVLIQSTAGKVGEAWHTEYVAAKSDE